ncbi:nucleotide exchange factor GrpE [Nocardioides sp. TF02-7]|uniref:nucleotide exchange factor GrpE n=1 Tax=Nocardioides sp. TF02-7 TaxID=2917724 RepID=UPI001F05C2F0|nr:nucleotide exchange factor GrpE [Nocardioides sp. TF02-7]UMG91968.1 nucleotide exchange factor GrpE [Nocardioides sp. TF02-7]
MPDPNLQDLHDAVTDVGRIVARQGAAIDRLVDDSRAAAARARAGADVPLLVDLLALHRDATACAATARSRRERDAFTAVARGLERLVTGRGGTLVAPAPGEPFDATRMEAAEVVATDDPAADRTVASVLEAGLWLTEAGRSVRPARVAVHRHSGG